MVGLFSGSTFTTSLLLESRVEFGGNLDIVVGIALNVEELKFGVCCGDFTLWTAFDAVLFDLTSGRCLPLQDELFSITFGLQQLWWLSNYTRRNINLILWA